MLKRHGLKLVEVRRYAVVRREDDGEELCGGTCDEVSKWVARKMREDWLEP